MVNGAYLITNQGTQEVSTTLGVTPFPPSNCLNEAGNSKKPRFCKGQKFPSEEVPRKNGGLLLFFYLLMFNSDNTKKTKKEAQKNLIQINFSGMSKIAPQF